MSDLHLYNTLSRKKEKFTPLDEKEVTLYTCGPTVYDYLHIGNLRAYAFEDVLRRTLEYYGYNVKHIMNITDVGHLTSNENEGEDKMEKGAKREGKTAWEVAEFYTEIFKEDMKKLHIIPPLQWTKATDHIQEQIDLVKTLEEKGVTYTIDDGVYFDTAKLDNYGELARLDIEGLKEGARVEKNDQRKNPTDFVLWKFSPKNEQRDMEWESPWGTGFPGWHIECSAMAMKHLGETIDIHCGGVDHIPVHHTNEIAQSETATGKKFANYWMHNEFLNLMINGEIVKMSKSSGNFITLSVLKEKGFSPMDYRYLLLTAHYSTKINFSWESLEAAKTARKKLNNHYLQVKHAEIEELNEELDRRFKDFIYDDLNTPGALAYLWEILKNHDINDGQKKTAFLEFDKIFGLGFKDLEKDEAPQEIKELAKKRAEARTEKNWELSDKLRDKINEMGWNIEDTKDGWELEKK